MYNRKQTVRQVTDLVIQSHIFHYFSRVCRVQTNFFFRAFTTASRDPIDEPSSGDRDRARRRRSSSPSIEERATKRIALSAMDHDRAHPTLQANSTPMPLTNGHHAPARDAATPGGWKRSELVRLLVQSLRELGYRYVSCLLCPRLPHLLMVSE